MSEKFRILTNLGLGNCESYFETFFAKKLNRRKSLVRFFTKNRNNVQKKWMMNRKYSSEDNPNIVSSPLGTVPIPSVPFHELIFQNWSLWERKTAVQCGATGKKYTFRQVMQHSKTLAASLQNRFKLIKGDSVAIVLPNCPEYPILILASSMCGVVPTTVNSLYTIDEIKWQLIDCKGKLVFTDHTSYEKCVEVTTAIGVTIPIVVVKTLPDSVMPEGAIDLIELFDPSISGPLNSVTIKQDDPLILPYSSGTTGAPKGVVLSHRNLVSNLTQISHPETVIMNPTTKFHQDTIFGILPMFHIYGLVIVTFYSLKDGCRLIVLPRFNPRLYITNMVRKKVNILYVVPPILVFLANKAIRPKHFKNLKYIVNAASPLSLKDAHLVLDKAEHVKIVQGYGMTESSPAIAHTSTKRLQKMTSIGIPVASTKLKISNLETGEPLPKGQHGELCVWGPQVMKGYLNRPEETQEAFDSQGWLRTGDIAYYDDDGDFFIVERMKDLIKVKGFQVAPAELEEVLRTHPKIKDAAVVGVPDVDSGEVPRAFVILKEGIQMTEEEIQSFIQKKLSSYKHLKGGVKFVDDFPRNNIGKVLRKKLKNFED